MVTTVLPLFLLALNASPVHMGFLEGTAIALSFFAKVGAGLWSDATRQRKPIIAVGIVLTGVSKFLFVVAHTFPTVVFARCFDRLSKGIRSSPTDALIADFSRESNQGKHYGVRQTMYTLGAVAGVLATSILLKLFPGCYRLLFGIASVLACLSLIPLFMIRELKSDAEKTQEKWKFKHMKQLPPILFWLMFLLFFLMIARFSETFLVWHAKEMGASEALAPVAVLLFELVHAFSAYPVGRVADRMDRLVLLRIGIGILIAADVICSVTSFGGLWFGLVLAGLHLGITQGLISALIAQHTPAHLRGTAFALYYLVVGFAIFASNALAGYMAVGLGSHGPFVGGGIFASLALLFSTTRPWGRKA